MSPDESPNQVSILIADEQPTARTSLRRLLERDGFRVSAEAGDGAAAVAAAEREAPDLCVVDALLPGAIPAVADITARSPKTAVVVLTASRRREHLFAALRAGAVGYLLKDMDPTRLPDALRGVLAGEAAIPRPLVAALVSEYRTQGRYRLVATHAGGAEISRREWEVAELLAEQLSTAQIAERLYLSPVTVRRHVSSLVRKLGARDRAAAIELLADERKG